MPQGKTVAQLNPLSSPSSDDLLLVYDNATSDSYRTSVSELRTALIATTPVGSATTASYTFTGDSNTGLFSPGADQVSFTTGGTERFRIDSNGQLEANSLGSAAAPVFTFIGDPDTGVYSPGANQLAFSTGGAGRVFIDASGNFGVGTNSPVYKLDVSGAIRSNIEINNSTTNGTTTFRELSSNNGVEVHIRPGAGKSGYLSFTENTIADRWSIGIQGGSGDLRFISGAPTSGTERLRIDSNGQLEIAGLGSAGAPALAWLNDQNTGIFSPGADTFAIATGGTGRVFVDASGNFGIGVASPLQKLHVAGGIWIHGSSTLGTASSPGVISYEYPYTRCYIGDGTGYGWAFSKRSSSVTTDLLTIKDDTGNVGIGTSSPGAKLDVSGSIGLTNNSPISFRDAGNTLRRTALLSGSNFYFGDIDNAISGSALYLSSNNIITANTNGSERLRIDSSGNVQIGTTSSGGARLTVQGGAILVRTDANILQVNDAADTSYWFRMTRNGSDFEISNRQAGALKLLTSDVERLRIDSSGNTKPGADNAYTLGASGTRWSAVWAANGTIQTSDERQKTNITDSALGLDFIKSLRPVSYTWKVGRNEVSTDESGNTITTPVPGTRTHWGFIAQEVKELADSAGVDFGGWILSDKDNPDSEQGLRYDQFIAPLVKALQEAVIRIETLEQKIATLEGN